jgi:hypothetical protein
MVSLVSKGLMPKSGWGIATTLNGFNGLPRFQGIDAQDAAHPPKVASSFSFNGLPRFQGIDAPALAGATIGYALVSMVSLVSKGLMPWDCE